MKIFDSRKSIVMASIGVLFATLALVSCEKREEPLLNDMAKYSKTVVFTEQQVQTRATAYTDYNTQIPDADYVLRAEESTDSMFLSAYVTDLESEQLLTRATETTTENLGQFRILAYNVGSDNSLGINEGLSQLVGKKSDGTWSYGAISGHSEKNWSELGNNKVKFYAYANLPTAEGAVSNTGLPSTQFRLTLPRNATEQTDIIVAEAAGTYQSSNTQQVPLQFNHICAGIKFVVGNKTDISGYIKSIKVHNVISQGVYDIQTQRWIEYNSTNVETLIAAENLTSNGASGAKVGSTLMVIPQPNDNAIIEVVFVSKTIDENGQEKLAERTLKANLSGSWNAGEMYTYKISNHKIDLLAFTSQIPIQDAHYVICPITIRLDKGLNSAELKASLITPEKVEMRTTLNKYEEDGYWFANSGLGFTYAGKSYPKRTENITWNNSDIDLADNKDITVYIFIPENISSDTRDINLELTGKTDIGTNAEAKTLTIRQFCPAPTGCERIEEYPAFSEWGPYWEFTDKTSKKITYSFKNATNTFWVDAYFAIADNSVLSWIFNVDLPTGVGDVKFESSFLGVGIGVESVSIDYTQYLKYDTKGKSGLANTQLIYNGAGGVDLSALLQLQQNIIDAGGEISSENSYTEKSFERTAFLTAIKKNKMTITYQNERGQELVTISIANDDIKWYLPSITEIATDYVNVIDPLTNNIVAGETQLSGVYWSSTTSEGTLAPDYSQAFDWDNKANNPIINQIRSYPGYKCRAVRTGYSK